MDACDEIRKVDAIYIEYNAFRGCPTILSTNMSSIDEISER